jgi:DNA-binding NtrC family response regulator
LFTLPSEGISPEEVENDFVHLAIAKTGGNITRAAYLLNISRAQMRYRLKKRRRKFCGGLRNRFFRAILYE